MLLLRLSILASSMTLAASAKLPPFMRVLEEDNDGDVFYSETLPEDLANYSIKYQGCAVQNGLAADDWFGEAPEEAYMEETAFVRFNLCPTDQCKSSHAQGCNDDSAGKYFLEMNTYLRYQLEWQRENNEMTCDYYYQLAEYAAEEAGEDFDEDSYVWPMYCEKYFEDENVELEYFDMADYIECAEVADTYGNVYYMAAACSEQNGAVVFQVYSDESCTVESEKSADDIFGYTVLWDQKSLMAAECISCEESQLNSNADDEEDADEVLEFCEVMYQRSGSCEPSDVLTGYQSSCSAIADISMLLSDGTWAQVTNGSNSTAAAVFVGLFSLSTLLLGAWTLHLRGQIEKHSVNLA